MLPPPASLMLKVQVPGPQLNVCLEPAGTFTLFGVIEKTLGFPVAAPACAPAESPVPAEAPAPLEPSGLLSAPLAPPAASIAAARAEVAGPQPIAQDMSKGMAVCQIFKEAGASSSYSLPLFT